MRRSAVVFVTILFAVIAAIAISSPAEAKSKRAASPNDLACKGIYEMCIGMCEAEDDAGRGDWSSCVHSCNDAYTQCKKRDDMALTTGASLSSPNTSVYDPGTGVGGGSGGSGNGGGTGGGGNANAGTFGGGNAGFASDGGGGGTIL